MMNEKSKSGERQVGLEKGATDFLIQQTNERIVALSPDFRIVDANEAYLDAVAKSKHEVIGAHCYEVTHGLNAPCSGSQPGLECQLNALHRYRRNDQPHPALLCARIQPRVLPLLQRG